MNFAQNEAPPRFELGISCLLDRRFNQLSHGANTAKCDKYAIYVLKQCLKSSRFGYTYFMSLVDFILQNYIPMSLKAWIQLPVWEIFYFCKFSKLRFPHHICLYSSVAEHWSCKPGVVSSILTGGIIFVGLLNML